jgi:23S rRNA pseudouridine2605 synthase
VKVKGVLEDLHLQQLRRGVTLEDGQTAPAKVKKAGKAQANSWIEISIHEGRKHQVKRMFDHIGHPVIRLKRIQFGPLNLGKLLPGKTRYLTDNEANDLRQLLTLSGPPSRTTTKISKPRPKIPRATPSTQRSPRRPKTKTS